MLMCDNKLEIGAWRWAPGLHRLRAGLSSCRPLLGHHRPYGCDGMVQEGAQTARVRSGSRLEIPADAWEKCDACGHIDISEKFEKALNVCPECGRHRRFIAEEYIELLSDAGHLARALRGLRSSRSAELRALSRAPRLPAKKAGDADADYAGIGAARRDSV